MIIANRNNKIYWLHLHLYDPEKIFKKKKKSSIFKVHSCKIIDKNITDIEVAELKQRFCLKFLQLDECVISLVRWGVL